jgi:hypothetical protein
MDPLGEARTLVRNLGQLRLARMAMSPRRSGRRLEPYQAAGVATVLYAALCGLVRVKLLRRVPAAQHSAVRGQHGRDRQTIARGPDRVHRYRGVPVGSVQALTDDCQRPRTTAAGDHLGLSRGDQVATGAAASSGKRGTTARPEPMLLSVVKGRFLVVRTGDGRQSGQGPISPSATRGVFGGAGAGWPANRFKDNPCWVSGPLRAGLQRPSAVRLAT